MIELVKDTIDKKDINQLIKWLRTYPRLTKGELTTKFEEKWSRMLGVEHSVFVNSGSSAILMMLQALLESGRVKRGSKIVVPALSWATDFSSPVQLGFEPIVCDCNLEDLSVDLKQLKEIFEVEKPSALILVSVLGLVPDMDAVVQLCQEHNVVLLEDVCESLGSTYKGRQLGTFGAMSIFSTYFGHHISTIEGGMVCTNDPELNMVLKAIRNHGWDRDLTPEQKTELRTAFGVDDFSALYTFYFLGFNFRSTDLQAFLGMGQLDKLPSIVKKRNKNFLQYKKEIYNFWSPQSSENGFVSNFAYPVLLQNKEEALVRLNAAGVQVRPLICGSMTSQPFYTKNFPTPKYDTPNARLVDKHGFYLPNHPKLTRKEISVVCAAIKDLW